MKIQSELLNDYKSLFPDDKLKDIAARTGINITRIFRIFNGAILKLNEYEIFCDIIKNGKPDQSCNKLHHENMQVISSAMDRLPNYQVKKAIDQLTYYLHIQELKNI